MARAKALSFDRRMPLVMSTTRPISGRLAILRSSRICGWLVGSPPEMATDSHWPSASTRPSISVEKSAGDMWFEYWLSTMQIGHSRLQWSVTSMIGRQVCCS